MTTLISVTGNLDISWRCDCVLCGWPDDGAVKERQKVGVDGAKRKEKKTLLLLQQFCLFRLTGSEQIISEHSLVLVSMYSSSCLFKMGAVYSHTVLKRHNRFVSVLYTSLIDLHENLSINPH